MYKLTYISTYQFKQVDGKVFGLPANADNFFSKYLDVFDSVEVIGDSAKANFDLEKFSQMVDPRINVRIIESNTYPADIIKNDKIVKEKLKSIVTDAEYLLIKPSSRKGIMAINLAKKFRKPYMIELTGDIKQSLFNKSLLKKIYVSILYPRIKKAISDCRYGLYVTKEYLQKKYPISGEMCGCSDVVVPDLHDDVLYKRINKIEHQASSLFEIGLIGFYHDLGKGIDTAIKALALQKDFNIRLNILGVGTESDREKWRNFAKANSFNNIYFPQPFSSSEGVSSWIDTMDLIILPSRSEGLPRCIIEAMSRACPCITSNVCGLPELIDKEWLHDHSDFKSLSLLITKMLSSRQDMITQAQANFDKAHSFQQDSLRKARNDFLRRFRDSL